MNRAAWTQHQERSNLTLLRVMTWISLHCGRRASRVVLVAVATWFVLFSPLARRASRDYLQRVLDRPPNWVDVWRHMFCFGTTIHDRIYLLNEQYDSFDLRLHGETLVTAAVAEGRGAFLIGGHLGSFEVIRAIGRTQPDLRVAITMYEENAQQINAIMATVNPVSKQDVISLGQVDSMLKVREYLERGSLIGMLADRTLVCDSASSIKPVEFLGTPAGFPLGPLQMAAMLRRPVIFMTGLYRGGNRYDIHFDKLADFSDVRRAGRGDEVQAALVRYVSLLEQYCRSAPYNWFNYFDFWQTGDAVDAYGERLAAGSEYTPTTGDY